VEAGRKAAHLPRSTPTVSRASIGITRIVRLGGASELFESIFGKEKTSVLDNE
jgi:hypothetical protein